MAIHYPLNPSQGAQVQAFPRRQYEKVVEIIDAVNNLTDGSITTTDLTLTGTLGVAGISTLGTTTPTAVSAAGKVTVANTTDSTTKDTGSIITEGGIGVEKAIVTGTSITAGTTLASGTTTTVGTSLIVSGTTDSTVSTTGSITTAGGMGIAKALYVGTSVNAATYVTSGDGTVSLPAIGPVSDPDSGLYSIGANNLGIALGGAKVLDMRTTGLEVVGRVVKRPSGTTVVANTGTTLTAAMMLSGYVEVTGTTGSLALDSVANVVTALGTVTPGLNFEFIINTKGATPMTATNVVTLTAPASTIFMKQFNTTDVGTDFIPTITATDGIHIGHFRYTFQTATSAIVQRIG